MEKATIHYKNYQNIKNNIFLFIIVFFNILFKIKSLKYVKPFPLSSNFLLLISDEGISKFIGSGEFILIEPFNNETITDYSDFQYISFSQSTYEEEYIFCKVNEKIYFISSDAENVYDIASIEQLSQTIVELISYKDQNNIYYLIICFINTDKKLEIIKYQIKTNNNLELVDLTFEGIIENNQTDGSSLYSGVSCQIMYYQNYSYDLLTCFVEKKNYKLIAMVFDLENGINFKFSKSFENPNKGSFYIKSAISSDKKKSLICIPQLSNDLQCLLYNSEKMLFSESIELYPNCIEFDIGIIYLSENNEFYVYCNTNKTSAEYYLIKFDEELNIDEIKQNGICYQLYEGSSCDIRYSSFLYYSKTYNKFMEMPSCSYLNYDYYFQIQFDYKCNRQLNFSNNDKTDNIFTTILSTIFSTTTILDSNSISYLPEISTIPFTTSITQLSSSTNIFSDKNVILTTILSYSTNIIDENNNTIVTNILPIPKNTINTIEDNDFEYCIEKDIYIGKISKSKEELENNLDELITKIEIGKKYEITGDDYNITISPVNSILIKNNKLYDKIKYN